jgi:hypothetical protein
MVIIDSPTVSSGGVSSTPGGTTIVVTSGQVFLLRNEFYFDQPANGGTFAMAIYWDVPSSDENFTLENVPSVYWISGPENGLPVENVQWDNNVINPASSGQWEISAWINSADKNYIDGHFYIDFWLRAASGDGTLHKENDNHQLHYGLGIAVGESTPIVVPINDVTVNVTAIKITRSVSVSISPNDSIGQGEVTLIYKIMINNTGDVPDNYSLRIIDNAGWSPRVLPTSLLNVSPGENRNATLSVTVPSNAVGGTDNMTVTATSQTDNTVSGSASCTAQATVMETSLAISEESFTLQAGESKYLTATLISDGNPVKGETIIWSATAGTFALSNGITNAAGQVSVVYTAPSDKTVIIVRASYAGSGQYAPTSASSYGTITASHSGILTGAIIGIAITIGCGVIGATILLVRRRWATAIRARS